ncbi:hypothetical protein KXW98_007800 [Aspergillus fumigatus]|nr:hypothetical protein CNMCM8714_004816 [Aspergillus fumigatus]KAF4259720.1 hypothetical protein CNMCM8057_002651 [Aspergillus fumigatus]KAF4262433.1 hypothetical protein CNMCM8812_004556 [Aspergillus fumigatus]KAF4285271.1 hypothetical protein CNMCM8689_005068 [Aspergillus fumigatus]KAF4289941.1 hypothetical protein CNMCM8686_001861 [Aspergillus fumigatus]
MKWSTVLPLAISTLSVLPSTSAWEVTWTDADNQKHSQSGTGPSDCIVIDNPKGNVFKIDSQGEKGINMLLFSNNKCDGKPSGQATEIFSKASSQDLLGFQVVALSTEPTATATTGKSVSRVATTFPASETASTGASDDGSMTIQPTDKMTIQPAGEMTIQPTDEMSTTAAATATATATTTSTPESSSTASSTTSSAASGTTSNAAGQLVALNGDTVKGIIGLDAWDGCLTASGPGHLPVGSSIPLRFYDHSYD